MRPLDGVTVVSLEQAVAAPFATRQLADLGARVVKVERPGSGDFARHYDETVNGWSSYFVWLNRSKESLTLDVKSAAGQEILDRLLAGADVFVHNLAPGAVSRLGLGADDLARRFPRLIGCGISGYGADGPWAGRKAYDLLVQAEAGVIAITGTPEEPVKVGLSVADIAAGTYAFSGILSALYQRATTGRVSRVEVSLFDALAEWMGAPLYYTRYGGRPPARVGASHATIAPYGPFATADGTILLAVQNDREWAAFCVRVLADPALRADPRFDRSSARVAHRVELETLVSARLSRLTTVVAAELLDLAGIANGQLNAVGQVAEHPVLRDRGRWVRVDSGVGPLEALLPPVRLSGVTARMDEIPAVGQHTDAILRSLGYSAAEVARFREARSV